jgi:hypothetical protein
MVKYNTDIRKIDKNEGKEKPAGWTKPQKSRDSWAGGLPGNSGVLISAKAARKRLREAEAAAQTAARAEAVKAKIAAEVAAEAAVEAALEPQHKKAKKRKQRVDAEEEDNGPVVAPQAALGATDLRVVSLMQDESVKTPEGGFRKGHMAELKAVLDGAGPVEFIQLVPGSLELLVVFADGEGATRALSLRADAIRSLRRLDAGEEAGFWAVRRAREGEIVAKRQAKEQASSKRGGGGGGKGKGGKGKGGGGKGKGGRGRGEEGGFMALNRDSGAGGKGWSKGRGRGR